MTDAAASAPRRVLVVDDEESIRHAISRGLRRAGYEVVAAATGREGVDRFAQGGIDAVVTDVRLPDLSGLDLAAFCTEVDPDVPVLVVTGYGSVESALEAMRRGARDFLQKPFDVVDLVRLLGKELERSATSREERRLRAQVERRFAPEAYGGVESALQRAPSSASHASPTADAAAGAAQDAVGVPGAAEPLELREAHRRFELRYVGDLLARTGGNVAAAARLAGISRPNFHKKLKALGVDAAKFKRAHRRGRSADL